MQELKLIPPTDPRVNNAIAPFVDEMLKDEGFKDRKELSEAMFFCMEKFGGIGLSANQVGLPFNMFVAGGHPSIENGMKITKGSFPELSKASGIKYGILQYRKSNNIDKFMKGWRIY